MNKKDDPVKVILFTVITFLIILFVLVSVGIDFISAFLFLAIIFFLVLTFIQSLSNNPPTNDDHSTPPNNRTAAHPKPSSVKEKNDFASTTDDPDFDFFENILIFERQSKERKQKRNEPHDEFNWETHCEYCEDFLEDCDCDHRHESHEAISLYDCCCEDDHNDDDKHGGNCSFDKFNSF